MSLTRTEHILAAVHEDGINNFLRAVFQARPHYLHYGTPSFVAVTTVSATAISAIPFPGVPGGIQYRIDFAIPRIDLFPDSTGGASPLPLAHGQFSLHTAVQVTVGCAEWDTTPGHGDRDQRQPKVTPITTKLDVWAYGGLDVRVFGPGVGDIGFVIDAVDIVDITPDSLESVLNCLIRMMLLGALTNVRLPFHALSAGAFRLVLTAGPIIEDDQVKVFGTV